jgi:hypothetical protein
VRASTAIRESSAGGTFVVVDSSPSFIRSKLTGRFDEALCTKVIAVVDELRGARAGVTIFSDVSEVEDYDVAARERVSVWLRELTPRFETVHVLVKGRTIAWALRIVGLVSRARIEAYHSSAGFQAAYERYLRDVRGPIT